MPGEIFLIRRVGITNEYDAVVVSQCNIHHAIWSDQMLEKAVRDQRLIEILNRI